MQTERKMLFVLLSIWLQMFTCSCTSLAFQHRNINSWEILIGANEKEFLYDFCRYDATENIERCKNKPRATVDMRAACNCTVNHTANANAEDDSVYFTVNCNNETVDGLVGGCPQKLTIIYEHGDVFHPNTSVEIEVHNNCSSFLVWMLLLLSLLLVINVVFGVSLFTLRNLVSTLKREKNQMKE